MSYYLQWHIAPLLLVAFLFCAAGADRRVARRLRSHHPEVFRDLGRPTGGFRPLDKEWREQQRELAVFMKSDGVETLGDPQLIKLKKQGVFFNRAIQVILLLFTLNFFFGWYP